MVLLLSERDVADLLDLPAAVAATEAAFREQAAGTLLADAPRQMRWAGGNLRMVAGGLLGRGRAGARLGMRQHLAHLYDTASGELLCIQAYPYSSLRIGATVALITRLLAPPRVQSVGLIGSGRNAPSVLEGVCWARPEVERIRVYSRAPERREQFAARMRAALGRPVEAVSDGAAVADGADIVCTATDPTAPVLQGAWLSKGQLVISIGRPNELAADVYRRADLIVVTSQEHEIAYYDRQLDKPLLDLVRDGVVRWEEFGAVVAGRVGRPEPADQSLVVVREAQGGFGDVALASVVYDRAVALGRGQQVSFGA